MIREEMDAIGCHEMLLPVRAAGRALASRPGATTIDELFKLEDRKGSDLVLAMTTRRR